MMKRKIVFLFFIISILLVSCSNLANDLQKRKNQNLFNITIQESVNGTVTAAKSSGIKAGEEVILTVTATSGYELKTISVVNANNKDIAVAAVEQGASYKFTMPDSDVTVGAVFENAGPMDITEPGDLNEANGNTLYRIEHYKQDMDDASTYTLCAIQKKVGDAGSDTAAIPQTFTGYEVVDFAQKKIAGDGSTVVEIYYNRKTITYTFNLHGGNWEGSEGTVEVSGLYGATVNKPRRIGYYLSGTIPDTYGAENITFNTTWTANTNTPYTIRIYLQNVEDVNDYTLSEEFTNTGTTDTNTNYIASSKTGFVLLPYEQINIDGDGTGIINIYFDREVYSILFELDGGTGDQSLIVPYGSRIKFINAPKKEGFAIWNWYKDNECTQIFDLNDEVTGSMTLYANWVNEKITYRMHEKIEILPSGTIGSGGENGRYVLFGDYPQSLMEEGVEIFENITMTIGEMIAYCGSNGSLYVCNNDKYYKIEPIKWRIIADGEYRKYNEGIYYQIKGLLSESILFCSTWGIGGSYLVNGFINDAFTIAGKKYIQGIPYSYQDRIYYNEAAYITYGDLSNYAETFRDLCLYYESGFEYYYSKHEQFEDNNSRCRNKTDYADSIENTNTNLWWTKTKSDDNDFYHYFVDSYGRIHSLMGDNAVLGVVPAILIRMPE